MVSPSQAMVLSKIVSPSEPGPSKSSFKQELMEKMMNSTADPCKDFFEYAAGQADEVYVPTTMYDDIRSLLMDLSLAYQIESIQKIRKVYTDCLVKPQYEDPTSIETWVMKAVNKFPDIQFPIDEKAPIMTNFTAYIALVPVDTTNFTVMMPDILTESPDLIFRRAQLVNALFQNLMHRRTYKYRSCEQFMDETYPLYIQKLALDRAKRRLSNFQNMQIQFFTYANILMEEVENSIRYSNTRSDLVKDYMINLLRKNTFGFLDFPIFENSNFIKYTADLNVENPLNGRNWNNFRPLLKFNGDHGGSYLQFPWLKTDDAQHSRLTNGNFFTWGYFEYPKYDSAWSPVMHFSSLAFVMAHELGHNFELLNVTSPEHEATTECIIHFYSKQCDPKRPRCLMSAKTYFEDFPDQLVSKHSTKTFSGIRWAYSAYRRYSLSRPLEPRPRGRNLDKFNDDQLFFLNLAQNMASFPGWDDYSFNNNHSPNSVRIWGSMANFPAFGSAFSCPVGSNYNPRLKCPIFNMPTKPDFNLSSRNISLA
ncbi:unnamed protein product [Bursaphelenchus xylophilus]|uniref:(pine wood nematode) hypothetical protein n=1 Tax=Bursaphelenchus xylophilus TaxID=6326 RepID=A0A7I8XJ48_BURXY|nr:unnamed protein product [Bursaphelenchus xylophilus]CAG9121228.1 unnamed protein product [Bursaphelenchus xylophilus]